MADLKKILFKTDNLSPIVEPIVKQAYENEEEQIHKQNLFNAPHGQPWHVSFHASEFPGSDKPCGRKAVYSLMGIPAPEPFKPESRAVMEQGKAAEKSIVTRLERAGVLDSNSPDDKYQTGYIDEEAWLTGSPDAVIKLPNRKHAVEIKSKTNSVIEKLKFGEKEYDQPHWNQLQAYLGLANDRDLKEGSLYYVSRENPRNTVEFRFQADEEFYQEGIDHLKEWKQQYLDGELPERPKEWKWSELPCKWCPYKKMGCKEDAKGEQVQKIEDSNAIKKAQEVRPDYNYSQTRKEVLDFWKDE